MVRIHTVSLSIHMHVCMQPSIYSTSAILFFQSNFAEIRPYRLLLDLNDIPRTLSSVVDGRQPLADLSVSPRIRRQGGENTATVCVPLLALI